MRTNLLVLVIAAAICVVVVASPAAANLDDGWSPIGNADDPFVQEIGRWAVAEHAGAANDGLKFVKVVSGEQMSIQSSINGLMASVYASYRLRIDALNAAGEHATYAAAVDQHYVVQSSLVSYQLLSFAPADS
ncbi:hypothetical protein ACP4OV_015360 [Aristida adscensionis]